ncbi:MAG: RagB/SusD family nutrient uptake outer membrane protein [Paludibacteraceae bacterium]|nr:RagB/SusD family nutrient uptake outer membrane protein [Paludibacteraceae bacterium]
MKKIISIIFITAIIFSGCKELDLEPKDTITDAIFWKTPSDFKMGANMLYYSLDGFWYPDTETDLAYNVNNDISNGMYQTSETSGDWSNPYYYIRKCNNIIIKSEASEIKNDVKRYAAEAKFFRAYNYWKLFRLYGGVPIVKIVPDFDSPELTAPRAPRSEVVDFILQDLLEAAADLPKKSDLSTQDVGRVTQGAAHALRARVALFEGTWCKYHATGDANKYLDIAIEASKNVISSAVYGLFTSKGSSSYRYLFIEEGDDVNETILDRRYQRNIEGHVYPALLQRIGYLPTKKLADMYLCKDGLPIEKSPLFKGYTSRVSEFQDRDPRMTMTMVIPGTVVKQPSYKNGVASWPFYPQRVPSTGYITFKYYSENDYANALGESPNFDFDNHLIRYAEVLLIYAEAKFERNGSISDDDLNKSINLIRTRAGMPALTNSFVNTNALDMKTEIRRERTIELALEGFRYDDVRRWKTAETEFPQAIRGIKIKGNDWTEPILVNGVDKNIYSSPDWQNKTDADGFIIVEPASGRRFDPAKHYLRPLPTKEILLNPNLVQNPNW